MPIGNRTLAAGTRLVANYRKARYACIVSAGDDGKTVFTLEDGRAFKSPSAAGSAVMAGSACNGWKFWSVDGEAPAPPAQTAAKPKRAGKAKHANGEHRAIKPASSQEGAAEGMTKFFCDSCMRGFEHPTDQGEPAACPEGHPATVATAPATAE